MKNICASCYGVDINKISKSSDNRKPSWLHEHDYVENFIQNSNFKLYKQKKTNMKLKINVGKNRCGKLCLYWCTEPSSKVLVNDAKVAYNKFRNYGITKVNKDGFVTFHFNCPQVYSTIQKNKKNIETFYRHIHFSFSNKDKNKWLKGIYTKIIVCKITLENLIKKHLNGDVILINALPVEYYLKEHIPNSYNLHYKDIAKMNKNDLNKWILEIIKNNYKKLYNYVKNNKINIYELPIVVYCAHKDCNASNLAIDEILKKGFVNIYEFEGGMKKYKKHCK